MMGDQSQTASAANRGIDPYEILDLQIRPNAIIVLDSSGSMREEATGAYTLSGDDPNSKLATAKRVLKTVIANNKDKISFQCGQYENTNPSTAPYSVKTAVQDRFLYATDDATISAWHVNAGGNGASQGGLSRNTTNETAVVGTKTYYYVRTGKLFNGETIDITSCTANSPNNDCTGTAPTITAATTLGAVPPATLWADTSGSLQTVKRPYLILKNGTTSVNLYFAGVAGWTGATGACQGFKSLVALASCTADGDTQVSNINPYLGPEVFYNTSNGSILGYADGTLNSAPTSQPAIVNGTTPVGLRAEVSTPIAGSLDDIRLNFWTGGTNYWTNRISTQTVGRRQRTFIIFVTDGDDTCAGGHRCQRRTAARAAEASKARGRGVNATARFASRRTLPPPSRRS
jgi:hypothetical protein